jgi:ADP-ribose pyrophosphatase YjhB (NUDIX family)
MAMQELKRPISMKIPHSTPFRCVLHGSFRKHFDLILKAHRLFTEAGIEVLAPELSEIQSFQNGFAILKSDPQEADQRLIELLYLHNLKRLGENGFSYFVDPEGYLGKSASYELGIAQLSNVPCFFQEPITDHPAYLHHNAVWTPENLATFIAEHGQLPDPLVKPDEQAIHKLWLDLMVPSSIVAVGGIIEYAGLDARKDKEILLVKTHKWGGRYSVVGGKLRRNERIEEALVREIKEETGLDAAVGEHLCTFDQIRNSGYYLPGINQIFVDKVIRVGTRRVALNDEAQEFIWVPPHVALRELPIEPNARHTLELYASRPTLL